MSDVSEEADKETAAGLASGRCDGLSSVGEADSDGDDKSMKGISTILLWSMENGLSESANEERVRNGKVSSATSRSN